VANEILRADWERLRRAYPDLEERDLVREVVARGKRLAGQQVDETIDPSTSRDRRLTWLRAWVPRQAASIATLGFDLVKNRDRLARASDVEERTYQRHLELNREVIPGLKERADALRAEIARLEAALRARGRDPGTVEPGVPARIEIDDYKTVEFESQDRKRETVEFFRRIRGDG
jgi:uncharacterized small protein (DUF1192 family)